MLFSLKVDKLLEWSTVEQFCFTAPALALVVANLGDETDRSLPVELAARSPADVVGLDGEGNVVRGEVSSEVELCVEKGCAWCTEKGSLRLHK